MKHSLRNISLAFIAVLLFSFLASCSNKGVHMPKHRKRRHCDCPTFAQNLPATSDTDDGTFRY